MKRNILSVLLAVVLMSALTACGASTTTTGTANDAQSAQSYLPTLGGYQVTEAENITDAISAAAGQGVDAIGNPALEQVVTRMDSFVQCYNDVGAVAANIYTQIDLGSLLSGDFIPSVGAVAVVNQDRVRENLLACALSGAQAQSLRSATPDPCTSSGTFTAGEDTFTYIYVGSKQEFCTDVAAHFAQYGG